MRKTHWYGRVIIAVFLFAGSAAAQKGTGEASGIVRQGIRPPVVSLSGQLLEIKTGPCENTTGRYSVGAHLIVKDEKGAKYNIHLGPKNALDPVLEQLVIGQSMSFEVFRTERLTKDAHIAKSLRFGYRVVVLRDDNLRPRWASDQSRGRRREWWRSIW